MEARRKMVVGAVVALATGSTSSGAPGRKSQARGYPLYCAGIVVGMSSERDVRRLFGPGLPAAREGHLGGRYYVDDGHRVTLHIETGVDRVIEKVEYGSGVRLPAGSRDARSVRAAGARWLHPDESIGPGLRLGCRRSEVEQQVGRPDRVRRLGEEETLEYATGYETNPYTLVYEAEFRFRQGRLIAVSLYNGE